MNSAIAASVYFGCLWGWGCGCGWGGRGEAGMCVYRSQDDYLLSCWCMMVVDMPIGDQYEDKVRDRHAPIIVDMKLNYLTMNDTKNISQRYI